MNTPGIATDKHAPAQHRELVEVVVARAIDLHEGSGAAGHAKIPWPFFGDGTPASNEAVQEGLARQLRGFNRIVEVTRLPGDVGEEAPESAWGGDANGAGD